MGNNDVYLRYGDGCHRKKWNAEKSEVGTYILLLFYFIPLSPTVYLILVSLRWITQTIVCINTRIIDGVSVVVLSVSICGG